MKIYRNIYLAEHIEGFLTTREGQLLYSMARACHGLGVIVEIGSWKGRSTIWLASGLQDGSSKSILYAIDPHTGSPEHQGENSVWTFDQFQSNITAAGLQHVIKPLIKTSVEAISHINDKIELLFIDGAHEYEAVRLDYELFRPLVTNGGFIAFHDSSWPGVDRLLNEVLIKDGFKDVYFTDTLFFGIKIPQATRKDRLKNIIMLSLNRQFYSTCRSKFPKAIRSLQKNLIKLCREIIYRS